MILNLPWYVRFGIDFSAVAIPLYLIANYPRGVTHYLNEKRRIDRRKDYDEIKLKQNPIYSVEDVIKFRQENKLQN